MSDFEFIPDREKNRQERSQGDSYNFVTPKEGQRRARVSLIVDLGEQERKDLYEVDGKIDPKATAETEGVVIKKQKPAQQVAVYVDLVNDIVDYGGDIGKAQYRHCLNKVFKNELEGINFTKGPVMLPNGKDSGKPWRFHVNSVLSKLSVAVNEPNVPESGNIAKLIGKQLLIDIQIKSTDSGKEDKDGNPIVYKNVSYKSLSKAAPIFETDDDGNETEVLPEFAALKVEPLVVTFTNATPETVKHLRANVIKKIKLAKNYAGSNMQKAIEAMEAAKEETQSEEAVQKQPEEKKNKKVTPKKVVPKDEDEIDDDIPF